MSQALEKTKQESPQKSKTKSDQTVVLKEMNNVIKFKSDQLPRHFHDIFKAIDALTEFHSIFFHRKTATKR